MLFALINWLVIFLTTYPIGYFLLKRLGRKCGAEKRIGIGVAAGLVTACVYAQIFSLFYRVSWEALLVFATLSVVCTLLEKGEAFRVFFLACKNTEAGRLLVIAAAALMVCYCSSIGAYQPDTEMYHAQAIRWIEEYGVVKGLGNTLRNIAYNSSFFPLTALYSMKYVFGLSMHAVQGFWMVLMISQCTGFLGRFFRREFLLSDFAKFGAIYYATMNYRYLVTPSSDYAVTIQLFLIAIWYLEYTENREEEPFPYIVLCMIGCNCVTTKLSAGVILLLSICPICMLIRRKQIRPIVYSVLTAVLIIFPYLIRNVIISGWLLYPSTAIDLFDVPWKMVKQIGEADAYQIHVWGWNVNKNPELASQPMITWVPHWFANALRSTEKILVAASFLISVILIALLILRFIRAILKNPADSGKDRLFLLLLTLGIEYFFWQYSAPLPRYGYAYLILLPFLGMGILIRCAKKALEKHDREKPIKVLSILWFLAVLAFLGKKCIVVGGYIPDTYMNATYIVPLDYFISDQNPEDAEKRAFMLNGITFYDMDNPSYHPLPVSGVRIGMFSDKLEDGFYYEYRSDDNVNWIN